MVKYKNSPFSLCATSATWHIMQTMLSHPVYWIAGSFQSMKHRIDLGEAIQIVNNTERLYLHHPVQCFFGLPSPQVQKWLDWLGAWNWTKSFWVQREGEGTKCYL
jgi:hypothetical protein